MTEQTETSRRTCVSIFEASREAARGKSFQENEWGKRHAKAIDDALMFANTTPVNRQTTHGALALMLKGWCMLADGAFGETQASDDGFGGDVWKEIGEGLRTMLNYELGPLDGGTLDSLILDVLENQGFERE